MTIIAQEENGVEDAEWVEEQDVDRDIVESFFKEKRTKTGGRKSVTGTQHSRELIPPAIGKVPSSVSFHVSAEQRGK